MDDKVSTGITILFPIGNDRVYFTYNGGNEKLDINDIPLGHIKKYNHLHYSSYYLLENMQQHIIDIFRYLKSESDITISFDPGGDPQNVWQSERVLSILQYVDVFIPNEFEAVNIAKKQDIKEALDVLSDFCPLVVVKLGERGSIAIRKSKTEKLVYMPSFEVEFKDSSCCGDSFDAGFIYSYLQGKSLEESLKFANACGALQATKPGNYSFNGLMEIEDLVSRGKLTKKYGGKIKSCGR